MNPKPTESEYKALIAKVGLERLAALIQSEMRLDKRMAQTDEFDRQLAILATASFTNAMIVAHLGLSDREVELLAVLMRELAKGL